jgi:5-oxoprolinase (ATP-hydrolysing) subunit B
VIVRPSGERGVLLEVAPTQVHALAAAVREIGGDRCEEVVPAARTVLVVVHDPADLADMRERLDGLALDDVVAPVGDLVTLEVTYNGEDLDDVAALAGCSRDEVVRRHTEVTYTADFIGFAPGFAYLGGLDPSLHVPRLDTPRSRVPEGAVAIAGPYTAVYPGASPGGWRLIGRTDAVLWDVDREQPALLPPGTRVRFVAR